jgi:hypothetical protein
MTIPLQTFAPARNQDFTSALMLMPITSARFRGGFSTADNGTKTTMRSQRYK